MKNIAVLSILVIMLFPLFSQEKIRNYSFSAGTNFGFIYGQALEFVYPDASYSSRELLSELRYDMKPVFYLGLTADFCRIDLMSAPGFFSSLSFKAGIPGESGTHEDRDWLDKEEVHLTNFSSHTNKTDSLYWLDVSIGASLPVKSLFYIKPFISGSWMHFSFTGKDGYKKYAREKTSDPLTYFPIDDNPKENPMTGNVIRYQQDWLIIATGISIGTNIASPFSFEFTFQISPLTYCFAVDEHLKRTNQDIVTFKDYSSFGIFLEPKGRVSYSFKKFDFSLETAYRFISRTKGHSYNDDGTPGKFFKQGDAGAGLSLFDMRLLVVYRF